MTNQPTIATLAADNDRCRQYRPVGVMAGMVLGLLASMAAYAQTDTVNSESGSKAGDSAVTLAPIVVTSSTASGYAVDPQHAPASISVVTQEELQGKAYRNIQQALRDVPSVYLNSSPTGKGGAGEVRIRGMDSKYTLLMVDGVPLDASQAYYNGYGQGAEYGWLPPVSAIKRIEVIRGPMSTLYGSAALGGVINIITKPVADEWGGAISTGTVVQEDSNSGNVYQSNFRISGPLIENTLALHLNAGFYKRMEDDFADGYAGYLRRDVNLGLDWALNDSNQLTVEFGFGRQDSNGEAQQTGQLDFHTERNRQTIRHKLDWNDRWTTTSYVQRAEVNQSDSSYHSTYKRITGNTQTVMRLDHHLVTLGAQYRLQHAEHPNRGRGLSTLERWDGALFVEHEWFMTDRFTLTWGVRGVYDEKYGGQLVPRIYGTYDLTDTLVLKGGVSMGYRTPNLKQGDSGWIENACGPRIDCIIIGNSNLKPEKSTTYEIGLYYQTRAGLRTSLTFFHTEFTNKIGRRYICPPSSSCNYHGVPAPDGVKQYTNVGEAEVNGVEVALEAPLTQDLSFDASYTYTNSEITSGKQGGWPLNDQPEHLATVGLNWQVTEATELWSEARYQSETLQTPSSHGNPNLSRPGYAMVDVGASHRLTKQLTIYGGIYNLLDKQITTEEFGRVLDGRRYNLGVRVSF